MEQFVDNLLNKYIISSNNKTNIKIYIYEFIKNYNNKNMLNFYSPNRKSLFNSLSFSTNFMFNDIMCELMNKLQGKYEYNINNSCIHLNNHIDTYVNELKNDGFCLLKIHQDICKGILEKLKNINLIERTTNNIVKYGETFKSNSAWCKDQSDIINIPEVQTLISDEKLLYIIQEYLNVKPILCQTNLWVTQNISNHKNDYSINAQLFHRDFDHERWLKVFIYLNDVTDENGPHCFVKKSHLNVGTIGRGAFIREEDSTILNHYPKENIVYHKGNQGTIIIEDTRGYHKGMPVISGERIILQLEYAINNSFGKDQPNMYIKNIEDSLKNSIEKYPYIYQHIN
jgi:hypothetical protein